jgi:hypothetical protein
VPPRALDIVQDEVAGGIAAQNGEGALELDLVAHAGRVFDLEAHAARFPPDENVVGF